MHKNSLLLLATSVFCLTFTLLLGFCLTFTLLPGFTTFTPVYFFYPLKSLLLLLLLLLCRTFTSVTFLGVCRPLLLLPLLFSKSSSSTFYSRVYFFLPLTTAGQQPNYWYCTINILCERHKLLSHVL